MSFNLNDALGDCGDKEKKEEAQKDQLSFPWSKDKAKVKGDGKEKSGHKDICDKSKSKEGSGKDKKKKKEKKKKGEKKDRGGKSSSSSSSSSDSD
ncbi:protein PXR1-like [Salarias fasciatus]|uniref:protein PXR1-like n=1 Tax=Salarias fasciatus TaxID=181472 RepID=UPI0011764E5E|nr:protein PXR1-like [Salarias fasciatus]